MRNPRGSCSRSVFVFVSLVSYMGGALSPRPVLIGPDRAFLDSHVVFQCRAPPTWAPPVSYQLLRGVHGPLASARDPRGGGGAVSFPLRASAGAGGAYRCVATATGGQTGTSDDAHLLVVTPVSGVVITSDPDPPVAYEGARLLLRCAVARGNQLLYTWFFNRQEVTSSSPGDGAFRLAGNALVVDEAAAKHAGNYVCMAGSRIGQRSKFLRSVEIQVTFKYLLSAPKISFTISKQGTGYRGNVTCQSLRGSPPVTFHLSLDGVEAGSAAADDAPLVAWFPVAMVPGQDMGVARCRAEDGVRERTSDPLTLEVVPVGNSSVRVEVELLYRADSKMAAARLRCVLARGTFPAFSWSLNGAPLAPAGAGQSRGFADGGRVLLLAEVTAGDSGYYRCRATDGYDDAARWVESQPALVHVTEVTIEPLEVIAMAFCCFLLLTLAGGVACVMRMLGLHHAGVDSEAPTPGVLPLSDITSCPDAVPQIQDLEMTA